MSCDYHGTDLAYVLISCIESDTVPNGHITDGTNQKENIQFLCFNYAVK